MSGLTRWRRRALTIPAVVVALAVVLATWPALLLVAVLVDVATARPGQPTTRLVAFLPCYLVTEVLGLVSLLAIFLGTLGSPRRRAAGTWVVQRLYTGLQFTWVRVLFSLKVRVEGLELGRQGPVLVLVRHASIIDTLVPGVFIANVHRVRLRYVLKRELLWVPCLDVAGHFIPNHFVARDGADTQGELQAVRALKGGLGADEGVLLYPEGTRFTRAKRARALASLTGEARQRAERLEHLLPLRPGGVLALLDAPPATDVVFLGHHGLEGLSGIGDIWRGGLVGRTLSVKLWREPASAVPPTAEARLAWLAGRWERMDVWLSGFQERPAADREAA